MSGSALAGRSAFVTGSSGGIGAAIAGALAREGARVGLSGRDEATLQAAADRLGGDVTAFAGDLTDDETLVRIAQEVTERFAGLDILVHSNGIHGSGGLAEAAIEDFDRMWRANVRAPLLLTQQLLAALREAEGQIVFVNSSVGVGTRPGVGHFAATQHALRALAETLRGELNPSGIRVLNAYPGRTATPRQEQIYRNEGRAYDPATLMQPEDVASVVVNALTLPRTAEVTDVHVRPLRPHT